MPDESKESPDNPSPFHIPLELRREYGLGELLESQVSPDPIEQFSRWFEAARAAGLLEPNAMTLATADADGRPSARIVLLKDFDAGGFVFFTNYDSRKGRELESNPRAALVFYWETLQQQVRVEGNIERVERQMSEAYFHTRPASAQIGAWVSHQSHTLSSRRELQERQEQFQRKFGDTIPLPDFWGGYRLIPQTLEFWQGRPSRLHDRLCYTRNNQGEWTISRLAP